MASFDRDYDVRTFSPALVAGVPDPATAGWLAATRIAFHQDDSEAAILQGAIGAIADGRVFTGVYPKQAVPGALDETWPVGTYTGYTKTINVGGGALVDAYLISDVTVRPTHKRRGILRHLMTERLQAAAASGLVLAALTASESTIYRRFGFGPSVRGRSISIRRDLPLELLTEPTGRVELADPRSLAETARRVFKTFHSRTPGSVDRQAQLWDRLLGIRTEEGKADDTLRAAVHLPDDASSSADIDGYVVYRMTTGEHRETLEVVDLVSSDTQSFLGLWRFLGSVDLVSTITQQSAAVDSPLLHALANSRSLETTREKDHIWMRILDPEAALAARPYAVDGRVALRVHDRLGYCDGIFVLDSVGGSATVTRQDDATPDLEFDAATLATLYVGGATVGVLAEAGLVTEHRAGSVALATAMFAPDRPVHAITEF